MKEVAAAREKIQWEAKDEERENLKSMYEVQRLRAANQINTGDV